jgi:hypothetical protein
MNKLMLLIVSSIDEWYDTVDGTYITQVVWAFKMAFASRADILFFEMIQVGIAVGDPPVLFFVAAIADDSMTCLTMVFAQLFQ